MPDFWSFDPQRKFLIVLGSVAMVIALIGMLFYESPIGLEQFCPTGILAGAG